MCISPSVGLEQGSCRKPCCPMLQGHDCRSSGCDIAFFTCLGHLLPVPGSAPAEAAAWHTLCWGRGGRRWVSGSLGEGSQCTSPLGSACSQAFLCFGEGGAGSPPTLSSERAPGNVGKVLESSWAVLGMIREGQENLLGFSSVPAVDVVSLVVPDGGSLCGHL